MSKRMNLTPIIVANCRVISVLPTPVGPEKRNEPIGFSSSDKPDRDIFIDELKALIALSWPNTTRFKSLSKNFIIFLSDLDIFFVGIRAILATIFSIFSMVTLFFLFFEE